MSKYKKVQSGKPQAYKYTNKEEAFCQAVITENNQSDAYRVAYDVGIATTKTVNELASKLMKKGKVRARVSELRDRLSKANDVTLERIMREQARIAFQDVPEMLKNGASLKDIQYLSPDQRAAISGIEVNTTTNVNGVQYETIKIRTYDKKAALDAITKLLGGYSKDNMQKSTIEIVGDILNRRNAEQNGA